MRIKILDIVNHGSLIEVLAESKKKRLQSIPFDQRMFSHMWDSLSKGQREGRNWVSIQA